MTLNLVRPKFYNINEYIYFISVTFAVFSALIFANETLLIYSLLCLGREYRGGQEAGG
jgi:hypothetical protein